VILQPKHMLLDPKSPLQKHNRSIPITPLPLHDPEIHKRARNPVILQPKHTLLDPKSPQ